MNHKSPSLSYWFLQLNEEVVVNVLDITSLEDVNINIQGRIDLNVTFKNGSAILVRHFSVKQFNDKFMGKI